VTDILKPRLPENPATPLYWGQLYEASLALALAEAAGRHPGPIVVTVATSREADRLAAELGFFAQRLPVLRLPDYETLPYDVFSPHPDITSERLATLAALPGLSRGILVLGVDALLQRVPPPG